MELIYLPKTRFNNMSFCKKSSLNIFTKSMHNSSRNIQSEITNAFPTSTETVRTKNFLPSYSSNKDTKNFSNELKITPSNTIRNKSFAFSKKLSQYDDYYRNIMHNKFKTNLKLNSYNKNLTEETPIILYNRKKGRNKFIENSENETKYYTSMNSLRKNSKKIYLDKNKITPHHFVREEYINNIQKLFKGNYIFLTQKNKYKNLIDIEKYKIESVNNYSYQIQENKKLLENYIISKDKYIKHLQNIVLKEQDKLNLLLHQKDQLLIEIKQIYNKIEEKKKIINRYDGYKNLICSIFKNNQEILKNPNLISYRIKYLESNILELLKKNNNQKERIWELKKELKQYTNSYTKNYKNCDINIKKNEIEIKQLKEKNQSLLKEKNRLENDIKKNSLWIREKSNKINRINELSLIEVIELETIIDEAKYNKLIKQFPLHFTCVSHFISSLLKFIKKNTPEFFIINDDTTLINLNELMIILDMKYNIANLNSIYNNILIMLFILEKSIQKILNQFNYYNKNPETSNFIKKQLKEIEEERKLTKISQKDNIKQEFRNKILYKMIKKQNKAILKNRLVYSKSPPIINNNRCKNKIKKTSIYNKYNILDDI